MKLLFFVTMAFTCSLFSDVAFAQKTSITNFAKVDDGIYRGARPKNLSEIQNLKNIGIKTVINLQGGDVTDDELGWLIPYVEEGESLAERNQEKRQVESLSMNYRNLPLNSLSKVTKREADRIVLALMMMKDSNLKPIFIHCAHGADRTGLVIALYRVIYQNWSKERAQIEMIRMGHNFLHQVFTDELDEFLFDETKLQYLKTKVLKQSSGNLLR